jgi:hypothetical protein
MPAIALDLTGCALAKAMTTTAISAGRSIETTRA